ncbi:NFX1-type zinc finger-containing protein 1-like [Saccostrea echinata]|uniref:NFX1-type zinc finger-containing protein 1-like n=1 Tax=Saccostrea echinata TaxID=191078 RepID=UPI002A80FAB4|nr:NFX1-type zinc finger-containing protein 1-like [Saccostrea echinata]
MGRRKRRRSFDRKPFEPKRRRVKSPFDFRRYAKYVEEQAQNYYDYGSDDEIGYEISMETSGEPDGEDKLPVELKNVEKMFDVPILDGHDIKYIVCMLTAALGSEPDRICSLLKTKDFFRRHDVLSLVTEKLTSKCCDSEEWLENMVKLVILITKQEDIKTKYTKTILGLLSQIKCINDDTIVKDQIRETIRILNVREKLEKLKDDGDTTFILSDEIKDELRKLVNWPILPSAQMIRQNESLPILPRDLNLPYKSPAHYLIDQFSLFLEDFIGPLRRGIRNYMEYVNSKETQGRFKDDNVRIYKRIRLLDNKCVPGSGVGLEVQFDMKMFKKIRWESCNFLQYGNVVCLTYDDCSDLVYALIANRDLKQLTDGRVLLKILNDDVQSINNLRNVQECRLVMIESKSFYMVYDHTLKSLKTLASAMLEKNENIPFAKYLVYLKQDVLEPLYTRKKNFDVRLADFGCLLRYGKQTSKTSYEKVPMLNVDKWPTSEEMGLNKDQYEALKKCLTKRIGILQGPPGTGKTWMGLRIMEFLLYNKSKFEESRPILLLSYTNHALDQFFEKLLDSVSLRFLFRGKERPFVRVGGRCANERVQKFMLKEHRKQERYWSENRRHVQNSTKCVKYIDTFLSYLQKGIVSTRFLETENIISPQHIWSLEINFRFHEKFVPCKEAIIISWLCIPNVATDFRGHVTKAQRENGIEIDDLFLQENQKRILGDDDDDFEKEILHAIRPSFVFADEHLCPNNVNSNGIIFNTFFPQIFRNIHQVFWNRVSYEKRRRMLSYVQQNLRCQDIMPVQNVRRIRNVWRLSLRERWKLYRFWIHQLSIKFQNQRTNLISHFSRKSQDDHHERFKRDLSILTSCQMIGMTTTGAASNMELLREIRPRIVVVEEAAQVHEQHILGCLTKDLQHLILIGDHQQLRPTMNNYDLRCQYNTDVSLMERLVMNGFPFQCLAQQHRMRPEISCMLTPAIYPSLQDHLTVLEYQDVKGMKHNIFFIDHQNPESQTNYSTSYTNDFEVEMIANLYKYLILQGYSNSDITILSAYNDQVRKIRTRVSQISQQLVIGRELSNQRVHITAVDNFQGEENKIILLSLVRSNEDCKLGHLGDPQRICVLLSRAKEGFYAFGNFQMLYKRNNPLWMKIITKAKEKDVLGKSLSLVCKNHPQKITSVSGPEDFENVKDGGCDEPCATLLQCGHVCERKCHADNSIHDLPCQKACLKKWCDDGHLCQKECYKECGPCMERVKKKYLTCEHEVCVPCSEDLSDRPCPAKCTRQRDCGHICTLKCSQNCNKYPCQVVVQVTHPACGHESVIKCSAKDNFFCQKECRETLPCGHFCKGTCHSCSNGRLHIQCKQVCSRDLICGHNCNTGHLCSSMCPPCNKKCERICEHREGCPRLCGEICEPCTRPCNWDCDRKCKNSFKCSKQCFEDCERPRCDNRCKRTLKGCNSRHRCTGVCGEICPNFCKRCNNDQLHEMFSEAKRNDKALFIELVDCGHIFDLDAMDRHMQSESSDESNKNRQVALKMCPKCSTPIKRSKRYRNINNQIFRDLEEVKRDIEKGRVSMFHNSFWINQSLKENTTPVSFFVDNIDELLPKNSKNIFARKLLIYFVLKIGPRFNELERADREFPPEIKGTYLIMVKWIGKHADIIFKDYELRQFANEVERYLLYLDLILMKREFDENDYTNITQSDKERLECHMTKLRCPGGSTFKPEDITKAKSAFEELRRKEPTSCSWISDDERRISLQNVACTKQGKWYKCTNSHIYSIGFFVDTSDESQCPECRPSIKNSNR